MKEKIHKGAGEREDNFPEKCGAADAFTLGTSEITILPGGEENPRRKGSAGQVSGAARGTGSRWSGSAAGGGASSGFRGDGFVAAGTGLAQGFDGLRGGEERRGLNPGDGAATGEGH